MILDEAIEKEKRYAEIKERQAEEPQRLFVDDDREKEYRADIAKEAAEARKRAEWLEELKSYREIGTVEECRNSVLDIVRAYNKAIDDFSERIKQVTYTSGTESDGYYKIHAIFERDIDEIAEQLKQVIVNDITASNGKESL